MTKKYAVRLDADERQRLESQAEVGKFAGYNIRHAKRLLMMDVDGRRGRKSRCQSPGRFDRTVRAPSLATGERLDAGLVRKEQERPRTPAKFDGVKEAKLIAVACGEAPGEYAPLVHLPY